MLDFIIRFSIKNRLLVLASGLLISLYGLWAIGKLPVDVFPDLNRPTVSILTEAPGLAPEEVETLVTFPIETAINGLAGVTRLRSTSGIGLSIVYVEFDWGTEIYRNRQLVSERLQLLQGRLPSGVQPVMGPVNSLMGEIQFLGIVSSNEAVSPMELRSLADWTIRPRLMTVPGISQIIVMGGEVKQYQILVSAERLQKRTVSLEDLKRSLAQMSENTTGGFLDLNGREYLIRPLARITSIEDIENSVVGLHLGKPVLVKDIAQVKIAARNKRGDSSINGKPAVVLTIQKQPGADTSKITRKIEKELLDLRKSLPHRIEIKSDLFKQSNFIEAAIENVREALFEGVIIVAVILFLFLLNLRTTLVTLVVIPLSLMVTGAIFYVMGFGINTMTLGGLAIAIGELVDDAVVDVENVFRRLRENRASLHPKSSVRVIYEASTEVRKSIFFSTMIVVLVFVPLFSLGGIEGKLFVPLGVAYIVSILASLVVALTITPVLCSLLLPGSKSLNTLRPSPVVAIVTKIGHLILQKTVTKPFLIMLLSGLILSAACFHLVKMGRNFLPTFNEGTATIGIAQAPGISLTESSMRGKQIEDIMLRIPEVKSTVRRTGRAEQDEHAEGVHWSEIDVDFKEGGRPRTIVLQEMRDKILAEHDVGINIGQPISHRLDHLLSGVRAQLVVKIFGNDLVDLRRLGGEIQDVMREIPGVIDLQTEPIALIPQLKIHVNRDESNQFAIRAGGLAADLQAVLNGSEVGQFLEEQRIYDVFMRFDDQSRGTPQKIADTLVKFLPNGKAVRVRDIARVYEGMGPNMINRENLMRRIVVFANAQGRDLSHLANEILEKVSGRVSLPEGYFIKMDGQAESQKHAMAQIMGLGVLSILGMMTVLYIHFRSFVIGAQILLNVPLALIGSVIALYATENTLSVATMIGFVTLCGISTRNGILMISHYLHLMEKEGETFSKEMVIRGTLERLIPVLMTALTASCALIPLLFAKGQPGKEILFPVAVVIVGGLASSTLLDLFVTPALFLRWGRRGAEKYLAYCSEKNLKEDL